MTIKEYRPDEENQAQLVNSSEKAAPEVTTGTLPDDTNTESELPREQRPISQSQSQSPDAETTQEAEEQQRQRHLAPKRILLNILLGLTMIITLGTLYLFPAYAILFVFVGLGLFYIRRTQLSERQHSQDRAQDLEQRQQDMDRRAIEESLRTS